MSGHRTHQGRPRLDDVPGLPARRAALALLDAVLLEGAMVDEATVPGSGAERAEARGLADLVLRRLGQIDDLLGRFVDRAPKGSGLQILRLMAGELVFHGTPAHAGVDMAVRLARSGRKTERLAGLINAVGRRLAEQGAELAAAQDAPTLNMPGWLGQRLNQDWGADVAQAIATAHLTPAPHDLTLKSTGDLEPLASETGAQILPTGSLRLPGRPQISALPGFEQGAWWVQDAAAALPARMLGDVKGCAVLDLCAAPGGKTLQLAAAGADVTAVDLSEHRLERLHQNLARMDLQAEVLTVDILDWTPERTYDAILLDAPCSATGTLRRHPDLAHRTTGKAIAQLVTLQAKMLDRAFGWLAPGGDLVFCTCSLLQAEGEDQIRAFLERTPGAKLNTPSEDIPVEFVTPEGTLRTRPDLWTDRGGLDGFFAARLVRAA